ncbi:MAG: PLP-dependent aminotransferase family protein, partial [Sphingomonadales bacterium]|nr:PLP-dependent aminotransferase family protein [Sphingomonadales bacterium]
MDTKSIQTDVQNWLPDIGRDAGPKYLSISAALERDIDAGRLRPGDRLPPQRELADALGVDLGTVTRAYAEARRLGLIDADGRRGSFVREAALAPVQIAPFDTGMNLPPLPLRSSLPERYAADLRDVLAGTAAANRLQYQPSGGAPQDRQAGADWLVSRGIQADEDNVLVVSGGQTALHAIASATLQPGDAVCTGPFVYAGWLAIARRLGLRIVPVAADDQGIDPSALERACAEQPIRALYVVPSNDNPTTVTLGLERRRAIAEVARQYDLHLIEDDAYGPLRSDPLPPLATFAPERTWHVASLSKIISPALRVAYLRAPSLRDALRLVADVHETTIMAPPLNVALATKWLGDGTWVDLVSEVRAECVLRQTIVAETLPLGSFRADPEGYHLWIPLSGELAPAELIGALAASGLS